MIIKELDPRNKQEINGICAIFKDPEVQYETCTPYNINMEHYIQDSLNNSQNFILCKTSDNIVTGVLQYSEDVSEYSTKYERIGIHKDYRRKGIASKLIETTEKYFLNNSIEIIYLKVQHRNNKAIACYTKNGFETNHEHLCCVKCLSKILPCFDTSRLSFGMFKNLK